MKISKEFRWEMGHRLPEHFDKCKNIHGHSYRMLAEVEGDVMENGMVIDFYDLKKIIIPLVEDLDHAFLVYKGDKEIIEFLEKMNSKKVIVDFQSTVENICRYFLLKLKNSNLPSNIRSLKIRVYETSDNYAEESVSILHRPDSKIV
jgi:6-pyruvoyltetrahydropterin/6-carboxytetrahydropterin synthase